MVSFCLAVGFPDVFVSVKVIFGKLDFVLVSIFFLVNRTSLASRTGVLVVSCASYCGDFVKPGFPFSPLVRGRLYHLGSERLSSRSDEPCQFWVDYFRLLDSFVLSSGGMNPPFKTLVSLRLIFELLLWWIEVLLTEILQLVWYWWNSDRERVDWYRADFEWNWFLLLVWQWPVAEHLECFVANWVFEAAFNYPLFLARFLISSYGALFWLARLFRTTLSIISRLLMKVLIDATTNSSSNSLGGIANPTEFWDM